MVDWQQQQQRLRASRRCAPCETPTTATCLISCAAAPTLRTGSSTARFWCRLQSGGNLVVRDVRRLQMAICMDSLEGASTRFRGEIADVASDISRADVLHSLDGDGVVAVRLRAADTRLQCRGRDKGLEDEISRARQRLCSALIGSESCEGGGRGRCDRALSGLLQHIRGSAHACEAQTGT